MKVAATLAFGLATAGAQVTTTSLTSTNNQLSTLSSSTPDFYIDCNRVPEGQTTPACAWYSNLDNSFVMLATTTGRSTGFVTTGQTTISRGSVVNTALLRDGEFSSNGAFRWTITNGIGAWVCVIPDVCAVSTASSTQIPVEGQRAGPLIYQSGRWVAFQTAQIQVATCAGRCFTSTAPAAGQFVVQDGNSRRLLQAPVTGRGCGADQLTTPPYCFGGVTYTPEQLLAAINGNTVASGGTSVQCGCTSTCEAQGNCCIDYYSQCNVPRLDETLAVRTEVVNVNVPVNSPVYVDKPYGVPVPVQRYSTIYLDNPEPFPVPVNKPIPVPVFSDVPRVVFNDVIQPQAFTTNIPFNSPYPVASPAPYASTVIEYVPQPQAQIVPTLVYFPQAVQSAAPFPSNVPVASPYDNVVPRESPYPVPRASYFASPIPVPIPSASNVPYASNAPYFEEVVVNRPYRVDVPITVENPVFVQGNAIIEEVYEPVNKPVPVQVRNPIPVPVARPVPVYQTTFVPKPVPVLYPVPSRVIEEVYVNRPINSPFDRAVPVPVYYEIVEQVPNYIPTNIPQYSTVFTNVPYEIVTEVDVGTIGSIDEIYNAADAAGPQGFAGGNAAVGTLEISGLTFTLFSNGELAPPAGYFFDAQGNVAQCPNGQLNC